MPDSIFQKIFQKFYGSAKQSSKRVVSTQEKVPCNINSIKGVNNFPSNYIRLLLHLLRGVLTWQLQAMHTRFNTTPKYVSYFWHFAKYPTLINEHCSLISVRIRLLFFNSKIILIFHNL